MDVEWVDQSSAVIITTAVYDYSFGSPQVHGYLQWCKFEASVDGGKYYKLMDIHTIRQVKTNYTKLYFNDKLIDAKIQFLNNFINPTVKSLWREGIDVNAKVHNDGELVSLNPQHFKKKFFGSSFYVNYLPNSKKKTKKETKGSHRT